MGLFDSTATSAAKTMEQDNMFSEFEAAKQTRALIREVVDGLPSAHHRAFLLKFRDGMSYLEISRSMGKSIEAVSALVADALSEVRNRLRAEMVIIGEG